MDDTRFKELLPAAYVTAAVAAKGKPSAFSVGRCLREIDEMDNPKSSAYRIAMAAIFPAKIIGVKRVSACVSADRYVDRYEITYQPLKSNEIEWMHTPLLNDYHFGHATAALWDRFDENGRNEWEGQTMLLYKYNDPPRVGDKSSKGYRCIVYAEPYTRK